jgi:hypothetical protein
MARRSLAIYERVLGRPERGSVDNPAAGDAAEADPAVLVSGRSTPRA